MQSSPEVEFKVGDKAVYPAQGVAEVISIDEKDIAGTRQRFYVLRILGHRSQDHGARVERERGRPPPGD